MRIDELIQGLPVALVRGDGATMVRAVVEDSRRAGPGDLFVARAGTTADGAAFIDEAIERGAAAVLTEAPEGHSPGAAFLHSHDAARDGAMLCERIHGSPSSKLHLIGVTGTNGKTTVAHLLHQLLNASGIRCGVIGTVCIDDGAQRRPASLTTPAAVDLSALLARMVSHGCAACVMEASSHALHQRRTAGLHWSGAVFTNLSGDHLDYHGSMEAYLDAKATLFETLPQEGWAVINIDDPAASSLVQRTRAHVIRTSLVDRAAEAHGTVNDESFAGTRAGLAGPWGEIEVTTPLLGSHNVSNLLQAVTAGHALGLGAAQILAASGHLAPPPGRLEPVHDGACGFAILVDYAHTDDALRNALKAVRPLVGEGAALRVVFGCGGDRDRTKRPRMARVACELADSVILTSDNPRTEDPERIIDEIMSGVPERETGLVERISDRWNAIHAAVAQCRPGDALLIAGKGHEDYQIIGAERRRFDDREIAREALASLREAVL